jgi:hypothetical protein
VPIALAVIVLMAALDTLLNSFVYFPALIAAGGLAVNSRAPRELAARPSLDADR